MFWMKIKPEYHNFAITSLKALLLLPTSYLGSDFSVMKATLTKPGNRLEVRDTLRVTLTTITPR